MFSKENISLIPFDISYYQEFYFLIDKNRFYLRKWLPWVDSVKEVNDTKDFILESIKGDKEGKSLNFFVKYNNIVGTIGLREISKEKALVGYWIDEKHQGKNIITISLKLLIEIVSKRKITNTIILRCERRNSASSSVAKKCGFTYKYTLKNAEVFYGKNIDFDIYELDVF